LIKKSLPNKSYLKDFSRFKITQQIQVLEKQYCANIETLSSDPHRVIRLFQLLSESHREMVSFVSEMKGYLRENEPFMKQVLTRYLGEMEEIHRQNLQWIILYCDLCWPGEMLSQKKMITLKITVHERAEAIWRKYAQNLSSRDREYTRKSEIGRMKNQLDSLDANSLPWRIVFEKLSKSIFQMMKSVLIRNKQKIKARYQIITLEESLENAKGNVSDLSDGEKDTVHFLTQVEETRKRNEEKVEDLVKGYFRISQEKRQSINKIVLGQTTQVCQSMQFRRNRKIVLRWIAGLFAFLFFLLTFFNLGWDQKLSDWATYRIRLYQKRENIAKMLRQKKEYFDQRIVAMEKDLREEIVREKLNYFNQNDMHKKKHGPLYFTEHILTDFFFLLAKRKISDSLETEILSTAALLDKDVAVVLENIATLYSQPIIKESFLRDEMLNLRSAYRKFSIFPFMFLVIRERNPFLFVYPELILKRYLLSNNAMKNLGMDVEFYHQNVAYSLEKLVVLVVRGNKYPFKDRAGYFEGEFAIVFSSLAENERWTVYHEAGHMVDHTRYDYEQWPLPDNVELHAMLFPIMFADDRKEYIANRLVGTALKADPLDTYVQASKGVLNGLIMHYSDKDESFQDKLITDKFEEENIRRVIRLIEPVSTDELKAFGFQMYRESEQYLSTADPGYYVSSISNAKEIIRGVHGFTQRGFILEDFSSGKLGEGPRFIMDGMDENYGFDEPFHLWTFLKRVYRIMLHGYGKTTKYNQLESIVAALFVFVFVESMAVLLHFFGRPIRRRKFFGKRSEQIINNIYDQNPWSDGISYGEQFRERKLLLAVLNRQGSIPESVKKDIVAFKLSVNDEKRTLFDIAMLSAPVNPQKSVIINKAHELLFYLPFAGPYWARSRIFGVAQRSFRQKEQYNRKLENLCCSIYAGMPLSQLLDRLHKLLLEYKHEVPGVLNQDETIDLHYKELERKILQLVQENVRINRLERKLLFDQTVRSREEGTDFDRLEKYYPGDDIRRIDWKVTARSPKAEAMVRKFVNIQGTKIAFLLDMRTIYDEKGREKWARDFIRSINYLATEHVLDRLIFIMRNGYVYEYAAKMKLTNNRFRSTLRVLHAIHGRLKSISSESFNLTLHGLKFYNKEENQSFVSQVNLTDFGDKVQQMHNFQISGNNMNIFVIGAKMEQYQSVASQFAGTDHQIHTW